MFDWRGFLSLSEQLLELKNEASYRSAISRAYYFGFHAARDKARLHGLTKPKAQHFETWNFYVNSVNKEWKKIGLAGQRLRDTRNRADYDQTYRGKLPDEAGEVIIKVKSLVAAIGGLPKLP